MTFSDTRLLRPCLIFQSAPIFEYGGSELPIPKCMNVRQMNRPVVLTK